MERRIEARFAYKAPPAGAERQGVLLVFESISTRFVAWTESGVQSIEDVIDVSVHADAWIVAPRHGQLLRIPRTGVARQITEAQRWWEVVAIERPKRGGGASLRARQPPRLC